VGAGGAFRFLFDELRPAYDDLVRQAKLPADRIRDDLAGKIEHGELRPGEQLPTVAALCDTYGVSRVTVLKALRSLADRGLIETIPRWGSFVASGDGQS
jgi:GntR family transcriptional regulator